MDWELGAAMEAEAGAAADPLAASPMAPARRKISHRKNPSDTFAFAAGQLFLQSTPEDFYSLLEAPMPTSHAAAGAGSSSRTAAGSSKRPGSTLTGLTGPLTGPDAAGSGRQHHSGPGAVEQQQQQQHQQQLDQANAAFGGLHVQVPSGDGTPSSSMGAAAAAAATVAAAAAAAGGAAPCSPTAAAAAAACSSDDEDYYEQHSSKHSKHRRSQSGGSGGGGGTQTRTNALDTTSLDPRRAKRILANRQSAQRSRMKRLQYIHDLEGRSAAASATVKELQGEVDRMAAQQAALSETVDARKAQPVAAQQAALSQAIDGRKAQVGSAGRGNGSSLLLGNARSSSGVLDFGGASGSLGLSGLGPGMSGQLPDLAESDIDGMLADSSFLGAGLVGGLTGSLTGGSLPGGDGGPQALSQQGGVDLRKTSSL
ncbi:hypothetical protein OEZ85_005814 [Tetradesmus obliquus]|uniref:BZIP domain-containing protein n=1 Tax=Tetradesmus obliquus TaxID=3088 RepID=A0ABY8UFU8_TETOB|nr:hypothetical protein OEZ85_005814 [Tetradesmus obliquus]